MASLKYKYITRNQRKSTGAGETGPERRTMFFKNAGFKQLLKRAHKVNALKMANDNTGIIVAGSYWTMWIDKEEIPKEKKAILIEFAGNLPEPGEQIKIEGEMCQLEIPDEWMMETLLRAGEANIPLTDTGIVIDTGRQQIRLLQRDSGEITAADEWICSLIERGSVKESGQKVEGPQLGKNGRLYWETDQHTFEVYPVKPEGEIKDLINYLEGIRIEQGKLKVPEEVGNKEEEEA